MDFYYYLFRNIFVKQNLLILATFLSEAVEDSWCYFFENWFMKLKIYDLLKPLSAITQQIIDLFTPQTWFTLYSSLWDTLNWGYDSKIFHISGFQNLLEIKSNLYISICQS